MGCFLLLFFLFFFLFFPLLGSNGNLMGIFCSFDGNLTLSGIMLNLALEL